MLWIDKYRPKSFEEFKSHHEVVSMLQKYTLETIPNLIIHGQIGHNKKTLLYALVSHLFDKYPVLSQKSTEITAGASQIQVTYLENDEMVELCPSEFGQRDRYVIQNVIKEMVQNRPILSFFGTKRRTMRLFVIDHAEDLTRDAQAALRRTMEVHSNYFKIIMLVTETSKLIEPIRSRCLQVRMRGFRNDELVDICRNIAMKEGIVPENDALVAICENSQGNGQRALCLFEMLCYNQFSEERKRQKTDYRNLKLEWENKISTIVQMAKVGPRIETMLNVRKELYTLLVGQISPSIILSRFLSEISKDVPAETCKSMTAFALGYEERIRLGSKSIYHLEAFIASVMLILAQKK